MAQGIEPFPEGVRIENIAVNGTTLHVRVGGTGPAVVMLHGFADTGDMWAPLAAAMIAKHMVIVPDLRGVKDCLPTPNQATKKNQASDIAAVMDTLGGRNQRNS
jgi:pimeloyl-ACP methyl ester carboxylesterase